MINVDSSIAIGFVVAVYPEGQSIDVLMSEDGSRLSNVQVMVPSGSTDTGLVDLPDPGLPVDETRWNFNSNPQRFLRAVLAFYRGNPVCIGFLLPQITQLTFQRKNFRVMRHASDVYSTIDDNGNTEYFHPSGVYFRVATNPAHEDLTGQDFDKLWAITKNTGSAVHVRLAGPGGMILDIAPDGSVAITTPKSISIQAGAVEITSDVVISGDLTVGTGGSGTFTTPTGQTVTVQDGIVKNIF